MAKVSEMLSMEKPTTSTSSTTARNRLESMLCVVGGGGEGCCHRFVEEGRKKPLCPNGKCVEGTSAPEIPRQGNVHVVDDVPVQRIIIVGESIQCLLAGVRIAVGAVLALEEPVPRAFQ